ncbi:hypothetical protein SEVIR_7G135300v4 [Setaria viridis]
MAAPPPVPRRGLFVGGGWREPSLGRRLPVVNPATEATIGDIPAATAEDVEIAVAAARDAFSRDGGRHWSRSPGAVRAKFLRAIAAKIKDRKSDLALLETLDSGKPLDETVADMDDVAACFEYYADLAEALDGKQHSPIPLPMENFKSYILKEPIGVVGLITPWNYPLLMATWKVAPSLAAGCTAVLKPSELASLTCLELGAICIEVGCRLGSVVSEGQYEKIKKFISTARSEGATILYGGARPQHLRKGFFIEPTIITDVSTSMQIWREEVFGPVICIKEFRTESEAVELANDTHYGLAGAVISNDEERCERISKALHSGIVWINCSQPTLVQAPWGGNKRSGFGRELGEWGLENYLTVKQVTKYCSDEPWGWYQPPSKL